MNYLFQFFLKASPAAPEQLLEQFVEELSRPADVGERAKKLLRNKKISGGHSANRVVVRHHSPSSVPNASSNVVFSCDIEDLD
jgi:hypothetical protein